jgi:hypothetical protein
MGRKAILVCEDLEAPALQITKILDFFEVPWTRVGPRALGESDPEGADEGYCVLAAMPLVGKVVTDRAFGDGLPPLLQRADSLFLFGGDHSAATQALLRLMSHCETAEVGHIEEKEILCSVSHQRTDVCGPLSGLEVLVPVRGTQLAMMSLLDGRRIDPLISTKKGCIFAAIDFNGTRCYLAPCPTVIDIARPVERGYFDVADHFFSAVPLVMYLRHAFRDVIPAPAENGACLIVDDPVLRPQYGFVDFQRVAAMGAEHHFTCNVAFIPWNWRRTRSSVVEVFKRNAGRLSLSIHGCDHTAREFGTPNAQSLNAQAKLAISRMEKHQRRTGLAYDPVMVFPQGAFSAVSPAVLKHNGFIAAVNTEVAPIDQPSRTEIGEVWRMAILKFSDFAIYTRRYPFHGLHNFAFDLLLGKPCLIVTHSADFCDGGRSLLEFIDRLNSLKLPLTWRSLGEVIRRAYQQRLRKDGTVQIRMFGNEITIENSGSVSRHTVVEKLEHAPEGINRVEAAGQEVTFVSGQEFSRFELDLGGQKSALVRMSFKDVYGDPRPDRPLRGQIKQIARRYLSEFRDEAQARAPWVYDLAQKARNWGTRVSRAY